MPGSLKETAMLVAKVSLAYALVFVFQKKVMPIPVVGGYLPGGQ